MQNNLYTITVSLVDGSHHNFANMQESQVKAFKQIVWQQGCTVKRDELTSEQISPYRITEVLITRQSGRIPPGKR